MFRDEAYRNLAWGAAQGFRHGSGRGLYHVTWDEEGNEHPADNHTRAMIARGIEESTGLDLESFGRLRAGDFLSTVLDFAPSPVLDKGVWDADRYPKGSAAKFRHGLHLALVRSAPSPMPLLGYPAIYKSVMRSFAHRVPGYWLFTVGKDSESAHENPAEFAHLEPLFELFARLAAGIEGVAKGDSRYFPEYAAKADPYFVAARAVYDQIGPAIPYPTEG